jgi:hypothetical protein
MVRRWKSCVKELGDDTETNERLLAEDLFVYLIYLWQILLRPANERRY